MKRLLCIFAAICTLCAYAEDGKNVKTYVVNDNLVYYCTSENGITVTVNPNVRGMFEPVITITNNSDEEFLFNPQEIRAYAYALPGVKTKAARYRIGHYLRTLGDISDLEKDTLSLYTYKDYRKKMGRDMWWSNLVSETIFATSISLNSGSTIQNDIYAALSMRDVQTQNAYLRQEELNNIDQGFWRSNTIFPDTDNFGFIAIKPVKSDQMILEIPVNGETFEFLINTTKR